MSEAVMKATSRYEVETKSARRFWLVVSCGYSCLILSRIILGCLSLNWMLRQRAVGADAGPLAIVATAKELGAF